MTSNSTNNEYQTDSTVNHLNVWGKMEIKGKLLNINKKKT